MTDRFDEAPEEWLALAQRELASEQTVEKLNADVIDRVEKYINEFHGGEADLRSIIRVVAKLLPLAAQSQAATVAELRAEVERLSHDLSKTQHELDQEWERATAAESALATATAKIEKLEAALRRYFYFKRDESNASTTATAALARQNLAEAETALLAALQEDAPHGQ